jgi:hypothetical protein
MAFPFRPFTLYWLPSPTRNFASRTSPWTLSSISWMAGSVRPIEAIANPSRYRERASKSFDASKLAIAGSRFVCSACTPASLIDVVSS